MEHNDSKIALIRTAIYGEDWGTLWSSIDPSDLIDSPILLDYIAEHLGFSWVQNRVQVRFSRSVYTQSTILLLPDPQQRDLRGIQLEGEHLTFVRFEGMDLRKACFRRADLQRTTLDGADLRGADFSYANLCGANLRNAKLCGAIFLGTTFDAYTVWPDTFSPPTSQKHTH